ncbi:hypoxanthine phosphoribosyltransferase [Clostridium luticellarii]|jgi:hypoxanthine phosphoribosyltransferase|uniref:Hypoxanthine phosphoribosyltransferase n=1 Tax=Clostridium luticellarii TaxID=1691940 RepID=A0A2T0BD53_9CLOT|nr:hypoxanthine phosphoribosyltransferase [Clostridium luticellarii]MCI1944585.1 hypoxanthine phosphoribosyltransferase [Clostridium luticellarii]MCI1968084.1 hypoxanthine phosphoribosyltransferase [Clostridium luticellarii]MCI1994803.1 hypoxanthine phosphoribosyltransferase [Clostridium luticellarii]MCI2039035.1 hypoxanthine phosphoribosyltransferase [Clostridium luticellarii]PRR81821.1 Hypoxanthine-guanine phosphoribosyltransferase [Clostridium luticellarii]
MSNISDDIKEILLDEQTIKRKVKEIGRRVSKDYEGEDLMLVGILKGSVPFMADLLREITIPCTMDFMAVSSYGNSTSSSGVVRILKDLDHEIENKHVLIVEDIIDSGITLAYLVDYLKGRKAKSIEIACLLNKAERRKINVKAKYIGFEVPDYFLVGYGLDYAEKYRNFPYVGILKEEVYK